MDIKHFTYFVTIVECDCNLSAAAKQIHISQSALSKIILSFEQEEKVHLFFRSGGRLSKLTPAGEALYAASRDITARYQLMLEQIREASVQGRGTVRFGISPLVITFLFSSIISNFTMQYPNIDLKIIEAGSETLREKLVNDELDFAVLLSPTTLNPTQFEEHLLQRSELTAYLSQSNPLAGRSHITWDDLDQRHIAIFNESFSINRLLHEKFRKEKIKPVISVKSTSWDFLLESVCTSDMITILPAPTKAFAKAACYVEIPFQSPVPWTVVFTEPRNKKRTAAQSFFRHYALSHFEEPR